jgi:hypothetical protein
MFCKLVSAGVVAWGIAFFAMSPAGAGSFDVGDAFQKPGIHYVRDGIGCRQGARIVRSAGFRNVHPTNCDGRTYEYRGYRRNRLFQISVLSRSGRIVNVQRLRGGGGDGYDDGYDDYDDEY